MDGGSMNGNNDEILKRLEKLSSTLIADSMKFENIMNHRLKPVNFQEPLVGQARTVSLYPGDNLYLHLGIYEAKPGEILIVEGKDSTTSAYMGNLMAAAAEKLGIKGIIIDGLIRDKKELESMNIQIYANGFIPKGPRKNGPGAFDIPIQCGGVLVNPYDFVVADEDGIAIIPYKKAEEFIVKAEEKLIYEEKRLNTIMSFSLDQGYDKSTIEPSWLRENIENQ
ncbi:S-adenosylmethionine--2-demethylmenaquinone methyltransferase [Staphylococcus shinii]|uniref:RraA family protein n=1 Tax=Staphylococcus shinii TaxID=2912228 RepID=UPI000D1DAD8C|nr:RraA family protein [Staphylococcus shinii]PTI02389.1 S-adenosylmethionine--2-demethylmenaquinone methyltransferase [Staphylococcus shinii]PTI65343.1 S-adenosylmethionine--2-demethylmenaquinone methyltransferase [Staphylococcus shinii]RIM91314.1 RraA family protein [Staphylococcus shinii]